MVYAAGKIIKPSLKAGLSVVVLAIFCGCVTAQHKTASPAEKQSSQASSSERVKVATYNIEHFNKMFDQQMLPERSRERTELFRDEEDIYEVARTIGLDRFDADIIAIQECCSEEMLRYFNQRWLDGRYAFVKVFRGNVPGQWLGMLAKPGFEALEIKEYYKTPDTVTDDSVMRIKRGAGLDKENLLFSRGPAFVRFQTPSGNEIWVGCTHVKSKYGNSRAVTAWRIREMEATRRICFELAARTGVENVAVLGDFNDDFGMDNYERQLSADAVAQMVEPENGKKLICLTKPVYDADPNLASYHCMIKPARYRSSIDHVFVTAELAKHARDTYLIQDPIAEVASDHLPVITVFEFERN